MFINSFKRDSNSYSTNLIISMFLFLEEKIAVSCSTYVFNISESIIWTGKSEYTTRTMKHSINRLQNMWNRRSEKIRIYWKSTMSVFLSK